MKNDPKDKKGYFKKAPVKKTLSAIVEKIYYPPEKGMGTKTEVIGLAFRGVVIFCAIFGLMHLLYQSIGLYTGEHDYRYFSLSAGFMIVMSLAAAIFCTVASINRITKAAVPLGTLGVLFGIAAIKYGNPILLFENAVRKLYNSFILEVVYDGYTGMAEYMLSEKYSFSEETLIKWSVVLFVVFFAFLFYLSVMRKANTPLYILTILPLVALIFFFNIMVGNLGFAFIIASVCGFFSMRVVDSRYSGKYEKKAEMKKLRLESADAKREERGKRRLARLKLKTASERVYETAIDAEMGPRRARKAKRALITRARQEEKRAAKLERKRLKEEASAEKAAKKEERQRRKDERAARRRAIKAEKTLPEAERIAAKKEREDKERIKKLAGKEAKRAKKRAKREARLDKSRKKRRNRAAGGFAAAAAIGIALVAALIPFSISKKPFPKIKFIDDEMRKIRTMATDFLIGDGVDLTKNPYSQYEHFGYETLSFEPRSYDGTQIFRVEAPGDKTIYLKSRTAFDYDIETDTWSFATADDVLDMNRKFGKKFTSDTIIKNAYTSLYPITGEIPTRHSTINVSYYGIIVEQVHVKRANGASGILFMPSFMNPDLGVREYYGQEKASDKYTPFFDGIYTSRHYGADSDGYSSISFVYDMHRADLSDIIVSEQKALELTYELAQRAEAGEDEEALLREYRDSKGKTSEYNDIGERYFATMSRGAKSEFRKAMELEHKYREYAEERYTTPSGSEKIAELSRSIMDEAQKKKGAPLTRYEKVMAVIEYLNGDDFTYTLEPEVPEQLEGSVIEAFLLELKSGYCAHYATSAALLLRDAGIPVRYTEGYHAADLHTIGGNGASDRYGCDVRDYNSHTWIEVYFDDIGWIQFEATKTFTEYEEEEEEVIPSDVPEEEVPAAPEKDKSTENDTPETEVQHSATVEPSVEVSWLMFIVEYKGYFIALGIVILIAVLLRIAAMLIKKYGDAVVVKRYSRIDRVRDELYYKDRKTNRRDEAKYLIDSLFTIFREFDIGPEKGEQLSAFATRLKEEYGGLSSEDAHEVMRCVLKEEYGHGLDHGEICSVATYLEDTIKSVYAGLTKFERIKYRYIKRII